MSLYTDTIEQNPEFEAFSLVDVYEFLRNATDHERALRAISLNNWNTTWLEQHLEARNVQV
jgi:hypothetical protein